MELTKYDHEMLAILNGQETEWKGGWGAWMTATCETLKALGYAGLPLYTITEKGKAYLKEHPYPSPPPVGEE